MNKPFYGTASFTNSNRSQLINIQNSQGPGCYDISKDKFYSTSPKWSIKAKVDFGSCFKTSKQNRPPPGLYQIAKDIKKKVSLKNPNFRSEKYRSPNQKVAHLSEINLESSINTKSGYSFGSREELAIFKRTDYSPGPAYNPFTVIEKSRQEKIKNNSKGFGFGQRDCIYKASLLVPGPGSYFEQSTLQNQGNKSVHSIVNSTFGKSSRNFCQQTNPLGPGEYSPKILNNGSQLLNHSKGFKLKGKLPEAARYVNPNGPGTYDLPETKSLIGPRFNNYRQKPHLQPNQRPSPFTYEFCRYPETINAKKGFSLGKKISINQNAMAQNPGPGKYQIAENMSIIRNGGYMGRKTLKKKKTVRQDCFGKYDPNYSASFSEGPKFSFSTEAKTCNKERDETLGPNHYQFREKKNVESYTIGKSQRFQQTNKERTYVPQESLAINSTIGYLPSYLKTRTEKEPNT